MYQQPITEETDAGAPKPMRGLLIAAPMALLLWVGVAELARLFI